MKYLGGKSKTAKHILKIIDKKPVFFDLFAGAFNVVAQSSAVIRYANEKDPYLVALYKEVQQGWIPPDVVTEEEYYFIKEHKDSIDPHLVAFVGYGCSFAGKWFGGYARGSHNGKPDNYARESKNKLLKMNLRDIHITCLDYKDYSLPRSDDLYTIYCDPPYEGTTKYKSKFNHTEFWEWARSIDRKVYISEYNAPEDFVCIWSKEVGADLRFSGKENKRVEKLFVHEQHYKKEEYE